MCNGQIGSSQIKGVNIDAQASWEQMQRKKEVAALLSAHANRVAALEEQINKLHQKIGELLMKGQ